MIQLENFVEIRKIPEKVYTMAKYRQCSKYDEKAIDRKKGRFKMKRPIMGLDEFHIL